MRKRVAIILAVLMLINFISTGNYTVIAAPDEQITIFNMTPDKVSASQGHVVTINGDNFGNDKDQISITVYDGNSTTIDSGNILSVNNYQIVVVIPEQTGSLMSAQLIIERTGFGSASIPFTYIEDPEITRVITNTEVTIFRDNNGDVITEPDGTAKKDKETFVELYGHNINTYGQDEINSQVVFKGDQTIVGTIEEQKSGYIKVRLPEHFEFNKVYDITITNKYGGEAKYPNAEINLAKHDITQLTTLSVHIGNKLGIQGTNFPAESNLETRLVNDSGETTADFYEGTTPTSNLIEIKVPQVATSGYQRVKVIDKQNNTAITFIDNLQVLSTPGYFNVTAISPNAGTKDGGTEVRIIGEGLMDGMKVKFGDKYATEVELDTEMSIGDTTVLKAITPASDYVGPVDITIENPQDGGQKVFSGLFRYTEVENSLVFIDFSPTEGYETGGTTVTLTGINFQRTKTNEDGQTVSDENENFKLLEEEGEENIVLELTKDNITDFQVPGTNKTTTVKRVREIRVYFGGRKAEIIPIKEDGTDLATIINPDSGQQEMIVKTPQIALDPRTSTPVEVIVEIVTKYIGTAADEYVNQLVDTYTERDTTSRKFTYKPVPSSPELLVVYNDEWPTIPSSDTMAKGPAGSTVYIYGLDFRPDAKVYFFKETDKAIDEYLLPKNQGQVVSIDTLGISLNDKMVYRMEVLVPDIEELGPTTVLVQNGDGGRTKTLNEYISSGGAEEDLVIRQFDYLSTPVIDEIMPGFGSTAEDESTPHHPIALIKGNMFLVDNVLNNEEIEIVYPTIYAVPKTILTQDLVQKLDTADYDKYKAEILEVTKESQGKLVVLDGVKEKIGTRVSVKLPSVLASEKGYRDIVLINPDGGIARITDAFEYKEPSTSPEIISIKPDKGSIEGGQKVVIEGKDFDYDIQEILVTVTIGGEVVKIDSVERAASGDSILITITTPKGTEGKKILQVINSDGGTAEGTYTYTRVATKPIITSITPGHGGPFTQVIIKGDDFVLPDPDAEDIYEQMGTRVLFNDYVLNEMVSVEDPDDPNSLVSGVEIVDKNTILLTLPPNLPLGLKDVTLINPDTATVTLKNGFTYLNPISQPKIESITPAEGTRDGGTKVIITGKDFREEGIEVYFGEKQGIVEKVLEDEGENYKLFVTTPSYPVDEKITDRVAVQVTVINSDGGSDTKKDGFTFRVPGSFPEINFIDPKEGSTAGYETIVINGNDFRFDDVNENGILDEGEELPKVYFGWEEAVEVQYSSYGVLIVKTPPRETEGAVDITVTNPDAGTVTLKNGFTYRMSKPRITSITPDTVSKFGGTEVTIRGEGFIEGRTVGDKTDEDLSQDPEDSTTPIYGVDIDVEVVVGDEEASSKIVGRYAEVNLGDIFVIYDNRDTSDPNKVIAKYGDSTEKTFKLLPGQSRIIIIQTDIGTEGVKIAVKDNNLIVTRGLAPAVKFVSESELVIRTPAVETVGSKTIKVINRDNGTASDKIIITNPDSKPEITDIEPKREIYKTDGSNEVDYYAVESTIDGGITFTITGKDFRKGVRVMVGDQEAEIIAKNNEETELIVRSPQGREIDINKPLRIIVINEDGESADSALSKIGEAQAPAYYIYRPKESNPVIESVIPNRGSIAGGDEIRIIGNDFRIENITVRIGAREATVLEKESSYKELVVITPPGDVLGPVDIFIRNESALGEAILRNGFTYYSDPEIYTITPNEVHNTGGQKVTITGSMFLQGVQVFIDEVQAAEVTLIDDSTIEIITPPGELGPKDVTIKNTDGGTYTEVDGITYILPIPDSPTGFVAYPGHERSITLKWYEAEGAHRYKIYGTTSTRKGYEFIAETEELEYVLKDLEPNTRYYFRLWAINEYGESMDYDYASATTLKTRYDDGDDKYDEIEVKDTVINYTNGIISVDFPSQYSSSEYNLDLTDSKYDKYEELRLSIPLSAISYSSRGLWVNAKDIVLYIPMYNLMYSTYYSSARNEKDANVIITVSKLDKTEKARLTKGLTRKEKALTEAYGLDIALQIQRDVNPIKIIDGINFSIKLSSQDLDTDNIYLGRYNAEENKLDSIDSNITKSFDINSLEYIYYITAQVEENDKFIVIYKE